MNTLSFTEKSLFAVVLNQRGNRTLENALCLIVSVITLSALAQFQISLSWTPVPITGQTFGVALTALLLGRRRALAAMTVYLGLSFLGLPVLAGGSSFVAIGPTSGYLLGMWIASYWMGYLADRGWTNTWIKSWFAAFSGSIIIFLFGVLILSAYLPQANLFYAGILPFLPGDFIKTGLASWLAYKTSEAGRSSV